MFKITEKDQKLNQLLLDTFIVYHDDKRLGSSIGEGAEVRPYENGELSWDTVHSKQLKHLYLIIWNDAPRDTKLEVLDKIKKMAKKYPLKLSISATSEYAHVIIDIVSEKYNIEACQIDIEFNNDSKILSKIISMMSEKEKKDLKFVLQCQQKTNTRQKKEATEALQFINKFLKKLEEK